MADVLVEGDDLIGDGVNLAARIQQAADPGAIVVSGALFDQIRRTSPFAFDEMGEQRFENIGEPVRTYRLRGEIGRHVFQVAPTQAVPTQAKRPHSLAVMPIEAASGDDDQHFLAEGMAEELIFELGRFRKLFVSSRTATRTLEGADTDPLAVGKHLGVRNVLAGSIRKLGSRVRLSLTLTETETGTVVWSDRLSQSLDELASRIASTVLGRIEESDIAAARRVKPESMTAYEFYLRGLEFHRLGGITDENTRHAIDWFRRAIEADRNDPEANRIMGSAMMHRYEFEASRAYHEKALALSPSDAYIKSRCAAFYVFTGEPGSALALLDEADELDPFLPVWCIEERIAALYTVDRFEETLEAGRTLPFQTRRSRLYRAASRVALREMDRARHIVAEALAATPDLTAHYIQERQYYRDPAVKGLLITRLVEAGLPRFSVVAKASRRLEHRTNFPPEIVVEHNSCGQRRQPLT